MAVPISFILNNREVSTSAPAGLLVLDFLRENRRLIGTKEGCREGDCGACVVLVGALSCGRVRYKSVTSCLMPVAELAGKHLVTIEGINLDGLSRVQQAILDEGASQCGFCTPGIVMSITGHLMEYPWPMDLPAMKAALGGHLCRCTGYRSLKACVSALDGPSTEAITGTEATCLDHLVEAGDLPRYFQGISARLEAIQESPVRTRHHDAVIVAGGTDLYVQQGDALASRRVIPVSSIPTLTGVSESGSAVMIGPATTFEDLAEAAAFRAVVPEIRQYLDDIASLQIRNRATIGGNLINASPIGDITILLLALNTTLQFESESGAKREVALSDFYLGYKKMDMRPNELLTSISVPKPAPGTLVSWEKVAKRRRLDIATVNSTLRILVEGGRIADASLTCGGVAATPLFLHRASAALVGRPVGNNLVKEAAQIAQTEISPISDIRGSAEYKRLLLRQLIFAHFLSLFPETINMEGLIEKH